MKNRKKPCFEEIQHTADWAIRVNAASPESLFDCCAQGMYALLKVDIEVIKPALTEKLNLSGVDMENLLVNFLSELLYFYETEHIVFSTMELKIQKNQLEAELHGDRVNSRHEEIKAVTYHQMKIEQKPRGLTVVVVFDV